MKRKIGLYKDAESWEGMRKAGALAAATLDFITPFVKEGVSTLSLDTQCEDFMRSHGAIPAPLEVGFPKAICTSINEVVCHGIPKKADVLKSGDVVGIDVSLCLDGWYGDTCRTFMIDPVREEVKNLVLITREALRESIHQVKPGASLRNIAKAIESVVLPQGFSIVRDYCGHGIGKVLHAPPEIPHFCTDGPDFFLEEGMFFTIEPMINLGTSAVNLLRDGWTVVTQDRKISAQWEHTLGVTASGVEIFTQSAL